MSTVTKKILRKLAYIKSKPEQLKLPQRYYPFLRLDKEVWPIFRIYLGAIVLFPLKFGAFIIGLSILSATTYIFGFGKPVYDRPLPSLR